MGMPVVSCGHEQNTNALLAARIPNRPGYCAVSDRFFPPVSECTVLSREVTLLIGFQLEQTICNRRHRSLLATSIPKAAVCLVLHEALDSMQLRPALFGFGFFVRVIGSGMKLAVPGPRGIWSLSISDMVKPRCCTDQFDLLLYVGRRCNINLQLHIVRGMPASESAHRIAPGIQPQIRLDGV